MSARQFTLLFLLLLAAPSARCELPAVPVPAENPVTEAKRVLGKILFWDEQLSSDDSLACGTCHRPGSGGADPRAGLNPGRDAGTVDDVAGSPGIRRLGADGRPRPDPVFGDGVRVTARIAPSNLTAPWAQELFWDGRAGGRFVDPETGEPVIANGGALENQALLSLASDVEMARSDRPWPELTQKLERAAPLALADRWPEDIRAALGARPTYPLLFAAAFGDASITAARIAMAIASYQRTLVPDQTPWDRYAAGDETALDQIDRFGLAAFEAQKCTQCHSPPLFTNNGFANIGLRRTEFDPGRSRVTGAAGDAGAMKVPSLRNAGLRARYMHTGQFTNLGEAINFYRTRSSLPDVDALPDGGSYAFNLSPVTVSDMLGFIANALTDPRVAAETYPFDRPRLASER